MLRNVNVSTELFGNYSFFNRLLRTFLIRVGLMNPEPDALGPQASPKTQIAVTCEVRTALFCRRAAKKVEMLLKCSG